MVSFNYKELQKETRYIYWESRTHTSLNGVLDKNQDIIFKEDF